MPYDRFIRPINGHERAELAEKSLVRYGSLSESFRNLGISLCICLCVYLLMRWLVADPMAASTVATLLGTFCLFASFATYMDGQRSARTTQEHAAKMLRGGQVKVERIEATAVIKREESSDEGPGYFFDIGDGKTFHLVGQDVTLYQGGDWPNSIFELVDSVNPAGFLGIFCYGVPLEPLLRVVPDSLFEEPDPGLLDRPFAEVRAELEQKAATRTSTRKT